MRRPAVPSPSQANPVPVMRDRRAPTQIHANLTPMIDVTFLLIVFFVLVSQIVEAEQVRLRLPELGNPASETPPEELRIVLNVLPGERGEAAGYRLGGATFAPNAVGIANLRSRLASVLSTAPATLVNVRADQATRYAAVHPVMEAVRGAARDAGLGRARVNLVIVPEDDF